MRPFVQLAWWTSPLKYAYGRKEARAIPGQLGLLPTSCTRTQKCPLIRISCFHDSRDQYGQLSFTFSEHSVLGQRRGMRLCEYGLHASGSVQGQPSRMIFMAEDFSSRMDPLKPSNALQEILMGRRGCFNGGTTQFTPWPVHVLPRP